MRDDRGTSGVLDRPATADGPIGPGAGGATAAGTSARRRRFRSALLIAVGLAAAAYALRHALPHPAEILAALHTATIAWLVVAAGAEMLSLDMFARQQRRLLAAFGVPMSVPHAEALTYARSALSISMPAGAVVSAGFAYRQYQSRGASHRVAASVMVLSGLVSAVALTLLYGTWLAAATLGGPVLAHPRTALALGVVLSGTGWALCRRVARRTTVPGGAGVARMVRRILAWLGERWPRASRVLSPVADAAEAAGSVPRRDWLVTLAFAAANWLGDLACLVAVAYAFGLTLSVVHLAGAYLFVQLVRQIPITPGGIGVIEASLLVALVAGGVPQITAAAVVLVYRVLSCWAIVPTGLLAWAGLATTGRQARVNQARLAAPATMQ